MEKEKKNTKAAETKKKAAAITEEVKKEVKKAVKETKKTAEKAVVAVEKTAAKTRTRKKVTEEVILQYRGMQVNVEALLADAKADWIAAGHKEKDYISCRLYLKPEDRRAYYVINDTYEGNVPC